jgi:hypothetical protein
MGVGPIEEDEEGAAIYAIPAALPERSAWELLELLLDSIGYCQGSPWLIEF